MTDTGERVSQEAREAAAELAVETLFGETAKDRWRLVVDAILLARQSDPYAHADGSRECRPVARKADPEVSLLEEVRNLLAFRIGELPHQGRLMDNDQVRAIVARLAVLADASRD